MKSVLAFSFNRRATSYHKPKYLKPLDTEVVKCPGTHVNPIPVITKASATPSPRTISVFKNNTCGPGRLSLHMTSPLQSLLVCSPMPCRSPSSVRLRMLKSVWICVPSRVMSTFWGVADIKSENHYNPHKSRSLVSRRCNSTTSGRLWTLIFVPDGALPGPSWNPPDGVY